MTSNVIEMASYVTEKWRPAVGYEGSYEVSDQGHVRSLDRIIGGNRPGRHRHWRGRPLKLIRQANGYWGVGLSKDGHHRSCMVHALVLTAFVGPRPPGMEACHGRGGPLDNRLANLRWDTSSANSFDCVRDGHHHLASKSNCKRGHLLAAPNLAPNYPTRCCLACNRALQAVRQAAMRGRALDIQIEADRRYATIMRTAA